MTYRLDITSDAVRTLHQEGLSKADIARRLGTTRNAVTRRLAGLVSLSERSRLSWQSRRLTLDAQFWDRADRSGGPEACWPWMSKRDIHGYGRLLRSGHSGKAHRVALEKHLARSLGADERALHSCDNPPCINPRHLYAGSVADNNRDMLIRGRHVSGMRPRLSATAVRAIRERRGQGEPIAVLAKEYGVSPGTLEAAASGRTWRWVA